MVALNVWPTDGADGSVATEAKWRKMARVWAPSGVIDNVGGELKPTLAGTNLTIADGACWVDGHFAELLGSQVLAVTANGLAVVRFDPAANTAELLWRDGITTPAQSPTGVYEMTIAQVSGSALADERSFTSGPTVYYGTIDAVVTGVGYINITAAELGLASVAGCVATCGTQNASVDTGANFVTLAVATGANGITVRVAGIINPFPANAQWGYVANGTPILLNVIAWGTPA